MTETQEDEIDLREYINILLKRKGIIIFIFFIAVITATLLSYFVLTPIYQSSITFRIAMVDSTPVLNISENLKMIKSNRILEEASKSINVDVSTSRVKPKVNVKNFEYTHLIKVTVEAESAEGAKKLAENIVEIFIRENHVKYSEKIKLIEDRIMVLKYQAEELEANMTEIEETKKMIADSQELSELEKQLQMNLLLNSSSTIQNLYSNLSQQIYALQGRLSNCEDFKIIDDAQLSTVPIKSNKKLNIFIAGVLGLFVGIIIVLFAEFWQKGK